MANTRPLSVSEQTNLTALKTAGNHAFLFVTATQLQKGIMDATESIRAFLKKNLVHDYSAQPHGTDDRVYLDAVILDGALRVPIKVSAYRANSRGDTRFLPSHIGDFANGGDVFALFIHEGRLTFLNLTRAVDVENIFTQLARHAVASAPTAPPQSKAPEPTAAETAAELIASPLKPNNGQRFLSDPKERKCIEIWGMKMAEDFLRKEGFATKDVSQSQSFDFEASKNGETLPVEVKATMNTAAEIILTKNEVELHQKAYPKNMLIVVHGIKLDRSASEPKASGGSILPLFPWALNTANLKPIAFSYKLPSQG